MQSSKMFLAALCLATSSILFAAQTTWVGTATQTLPLANATLLGAMPGSTSMHIGVVLALQNENQLKQLIQQQTAPSSSQYGNYLTPSQFNGAYAPTPAQVNAVTSYLTAQGFTNVTPDANNLIVQADGTASLVNAAFNTQINEYTLKGQTVFANAQPAQVPAALSGIAVAVLGLNNAATVQLPNITTAAGVKNSQVPVSAPNYPAVYYPQNYWLPYNVGKTVTGSKTTLAVFTEGDVSEVPSDYQVARKYEGLPVPPIKIVYAGVKSTDTSGLVEWDLDTQASTGMADTVKALYLYVATSLVDSDVVYDFSRFASDDKAQAANASFGECEIYAYLDGAMLAADNIFLEAASQGQTVFVATGDTGAGCPAEGVGENGVPAGAPMVDWPAASPYVVAVGGTTLLTNSNGTYDMEISWYSGGGGISQFEYSPYWQAAAVPSNEDNAKGIPDIAMNADPESGMYVYCGTCSGTDYSAGWNGWGGTSLASPLAMGVWARLLSAHPKIGFASPALYRNSALATSTTALGFNDITIGSNGAYAATTGWDYTTGLGTFDVSAINAVIQ